jgi:hypothetical protein
VTFGWLAVLAWQPPDSFFAPVYVEMSVDR